MHQHTLKERVCGLEARLKDAEPIRVMIAEDNEEVVRTILDYMSVKRDIEIVAVESNGIAAVHAALITRPDVLVLDIAMPNWDGFAVMQQLRDQGLDDTRIIVLSSMNSDFMIRRALQHGAYYYMVKPFEPELLYGHIAQVAPQLADPAPAAPDPFDEETALTMLLLDVLGLSPRHSGTEYLKSAALVAMTMKHPSGLITKEIYPAVARLYGANPGKVERAIRHAIDSAWNRGAMQQSGLFQGQRRPSNGDVILALADKKLLRK